MSEHPPKPGPRAEWKMSHDFAEVAETLGCNTVDILALLPEEIVLFTPDPGDEDPMIFKAKLGRDADGILRAGPRQEVVRSSVFEADVTAAIEKSLEDLDD